ncbi:MAG: hypothetical protein GTO53_03050 [Planctomycetales bacterium]|nr:hypothetical protein [Planctomycetales bacterium]NIM08145.1 hypothetical protein [Planctomycetales bacterium]NIN07638.1 hypothetical protein [Planctomycetales bacterium]NIN76755.1 hypothetical protein [Planctomycetales bacterium]NIO33964.1 hypothetical protein [Planctomycetales bacterium]
MKTFSLTLAMALALLLGLSASKGWTQNCGGAAAADCGSARGGCDDGGCCDGCGRGKVCRLVCKEVEVTAVCYGTRCQKICVPGCGSKCVNADCVKCGTCSCDTTAGLCKIKYPTGKPGCARQKTVKRLVKYETKKKVKVWSWEIVDGCGCAS